MELVPLTGSPALDLVVRLSVLVLLLSVVIIVIRSQRVRWRAWSAFATDHGLRLSPLGRVVGEHKGRSVELRITRDLRNRRERQDTTDLYIRGLPETLTLFLRPPGGRMSDREVRIGDPRFQGRIGVAGDASAALAALDHKTRQLLLERCSDPAVSLDVADGRLRLRAKGILSSPEELRALWESATSIAAALAEGSDVATGLHERLTDPEPGVRAATIEVLAHRSDAVPVLRAALGDVAPEVRLAAARVLDHEATLQALALDSGAPLPLRISALRHLGWLAPDGDSLTEALRTCTAELDGRSGLHGSWASLAATVIELAPRTPPEVGESILLTLATQLRGDHQHLAVEGLGMVGGTASTALLDHLRTSGDGRALRRAADQALSLVTERLSAAGVASGGLSVASVEEGGLSLADQEASPERGKAGRDRQRS